MKRLQVGTSHAAFATHNKRPPPQTAMKRKKRIASVGNSVSLEIVKELGVTLVKAQLGI